MRRRFAWLVAAKAIARASAVGIFLCVCGGCRGDLAKVFEGDQRCASG